MGNCETQAGSCSTVMGLSLMAFERCPGKCPDTECGSTEGPHALPSTVGTVTACKGFAWVAAGRLGTCRAHHWRPKLFLYPPTMGVWPWAVRASSNIGRQFDCCWGEHREAMPSPTFLLHSCSEALLKPAVSALVPFVFVYHTLPVKPGKKEECEEQQD